MSREVIYSLLRAEPMFVGYDIYGSNAIDTAPKTKPFIVLHFGQENKAFADKGTKMVDIWVYDHSQDYLQIDASLVKIRQILTAACQVAGVRDTLVQADWQGTSDDLYDTTWEAITKHATYTYVSS